MSRKLARELCMKVLFEMQLNNEFNLEKIDYHIQENKIKNNQKEYINDVLNGVIDNLNNIDKIIDEYSKGWKLNRIANVDLAILRLAFTEIIYMDDIPYRVSINEAIEIGKKYGSDDTPSFINGILGKYVSEEEMEDNLEEEEEEEMEELEEELDEE